MAQRTVCLCDGKYIGIETIYTVVNGQQINIPEKLRELRIKSRNNELFCPCGCGSNLLLVAGDKNLREQHFRIKGGVPNADCTAVTESRTSLHSKIVLKCWLDEKLRAADIETRVPIYAVDGVERKYEFTFLSREKKIALSYCRDRANLSDEKFDILESSSQGISVIYVADTFNGGRGRPKSGERSCTRKNAAAGSKKRKNGLRRQNREKKIFAGIWRPVLNSRSGRFGIWKETAGLSVSFAGKSQWKVSL